MRAMQRCMHLPELASTQPTLPLQLLGRMLQANVVTLLRPW